jgi:hypothetical protein
VATSSSLADALVQIAEAFLAGKLAGAEDPEVYQVVVHVGTDAAGVSAETPPAPPAAGDPADPGRCHVEDGPAITVTTAQMLACTAALSWMRHGRGGAVLDLGRRRRRPNAALRRAARERDKCRCRFPGCESRRVDLHHIQHWIHGGRTRLDNLVSLCKYHHRLVHDRGYIIAAGPGGTFAFTRPDGTTLPSSPPLPPPEGTIEGWHDADITPETIIPAWYGERLDLDHALYVCLANAENQRKRREEADQAEPSPPFRPREEGVNWFEALKEIAGNLRTCGDPDLRRSPDADRPVLPQSLDVGLEDQPHA